MPCTVCGKLICRHTSKDRGQTSEETLDAFISDRDQQFEEATKRPCSICGEYMCSYIFKELELRLKFE